MMPFAAQVIPSEGWQSLDIQQREAGLPPVTGLTPEGTPISTAVYRGRKALVLAFLHGPLCAPCRDLLEHWGREAHRFHAQEAVVVAVMPEWREGYVSPVPTVIDPAGRYRQRVKRTIPTLRDDGVAVMVLDMYAGPWAVWQAAEPDIPAVCEGALEWLHFLALQCPE